MLRKPEFQSLLFCVVSYAAVITLKGWSTGIFTLMVGISALIFVELFTVPTKLRKFIAYCIFFVTPFLTVIGQVGVLTGLGRSSVSLPWQGIAFATSGIAFQIYQGKLGFNQLFGSILQPLRLISGPLAISIEPFKRLNVKRIRIYLGWIVLGGFFYGVLASGIASLLVFKESTESFDILLFSIIFEMYVYFNFCGISLIVLGVLNLVGARTALNFNAPFSANNLIGYWQRWHISFAHVLKNLFFKPCRNVIGTSLAVIVVFLASSMWHGVTLNFLIWGMFHAIGWLLTYHLSYLKWDRVKQLLNIFLMTVFILVGRIIFSEDNTNLLFIKLRNLSNFEWSPDALARNISLDIQTWLTISACAGVILLEIFASNKMFQYKMLRKNWVLLFLLSLTVVYGSNGLGSAYGNR
ncbi:MAG: MBOAT family O-acyltransferase [Gallionella sp.]|jgi:D-alanyl-lipoteichoic acid acyltransferase DltB (MBOAT superfamily)|nr:MBOAT family O-acyltransferase [Gallionella sp.]